MGVLGNVVCCAVLTFLCLFLLRSHFAIHWPPTGKMTAVMMAGVWAVWTISHTVTDIFVINVLCSILIAGLLCWYIAGAGIWKSAIFGAAFGLLHLIGAGAAMFVKSKLPGISEESTALLEMVAVYALAVLAAAFSREWRLAPLPALQLLPIWLIGALVCEETIRNRSYEGVEVLTFLAFAWMLYAGIMLIPAGNKMELAVQVYLEKQQKAHHFALQEEYYQQLRDKQAETRALWHDLNKYLRAAKAENRSAQALEQLESMLDSATQIVDVGNQVLNVILNEYSQRAKAMGTELRLKVHVPAHLFVAVADLYILLGNTLDNAMEACNALPQDQRIIDLTLLMHNDVLYYKLVNPYSPDQTKREADPMRGHGLKNVRRCVERYRGVVDSIKENGFFTITAHINLR